MDQRHSKTWLIFLSYSTDIKHVLLSWEDEIARITFPVLQHFQHLKGIMHDKASGSHYCQAETLEKFCMISCRVWKFLEQAFSKISHNVRIESLTSVKQILESI